MRKLKFVLFMYLIFNHIELRAQLFENSIVAHYSSDSINIINSRVDKIFDISGSNQHLTQTTINRRPSPNIENYKLNDFNSVYFDGINDRLTSTFSNTLTQGFTIFIILNSPVSRSQTLFDQNAPSYCFLYYQQNSSKFIQNSGISRNSNVTNGQFDFTVFEVQFNSQNSIVKKNKTILIQGDTGNNSLTGISLAASSNGASAYKGDFVEMIIYNQTFSDEEGDSISDYLMNKYAPAVDLGADISMSYGFCDTTLSSPNYYTSYLWSTGSTDSSILINDPGLYWLEGIDIFGRTSRDSIIISRPPFDEIELQNQLVCFNEPDTIAANLPQGDYTFVQWIDGNTNPTRILDQNESISYSVSDSSGCLRTSNTATITIDNSLEYISLGIDTNLCSGNSIELIQTSNNIINWLWNTQDTTTSIEINLSGVYDLHVTNTNGCQNSDTIEVTIIGEAPTLSYSIPFEICQGSELNYTENSTVPTGNTISQVVLDFGDFDSSFNSSGTHIYVDSGAFNASLQVSTLEGCSSLDEFTITVHPKPIISFATENYCPYEEISFSASNSYDVPLASYLWGFGQNENTSLDSTPTYSYGLSGNYNVELIAIDTNNCIDTVTQNVYIQPAPVADISILNPCEYTIWDLTDNSSIADTFEITTYEWNYGDETDSINPVQGKYYENYGEYTVQLVLTGNNGCVDTTEQNITVHPNPVVNYQVGPACKNTWTKFENLSTIPQGALAETNWLFNLQFEDSATNTSFNFPTTGIQLLTLTSTSDQGCIVDTTFTVDVGEELSANFYCDPQVLVSDIPINFFNTSLGADSSYWDFGDGDGLNFNNNIENNISYSNTLNGSYLDVILMTVNDLGCRDTVGKTLLVNEAYYDASIETLFAQDINGYLTIGIELANLGTIPLENLVLTLKTPENGPIQENWSGSILQGESEIYIFNAQPSAFISDQDATERFVCVEAQNANISTYLDINQENNTKCKNIEGSGFTLVSVYPNPTDEDITISILLSETSGIYVELYDQTGRMVYNKLNEEMEPGIHDFNMPFSTFESGIYSLRVFDGNLTRVEKIIKR